MRVGEALQHNDPGAADFELPDLEASWERHARYGFSQFTVRTARGEYTLGRLGANHFRAIGEDSLEDRDALAALVEVDASRRLFVIARQPFASRHPGQHIAASERMLGSLEDIQPRLQ